jgi:tetratricopeptide (TPR) repeat protein
MAGTQTVNLDKLKGQIEENLLLYQQRLLTKPDSRAFLPLAKTYYEMGRYDDAIETCRKGLNKYPDYWAARVVLAQAYLKLDMLENASAQLEVVVHETANNLLASRLLGEIYTRQGNLDETIQTYRTILNHHPECTDLEEELHHWNLEKNRRDEKTIHELESWLQQIRAYRDKAA